MFGDTGHRSTQEAGSLLTVESGTTDKCRKSGEQVWSGKDEHLSGWHHPVAAISLCFRGQRSKRNSCVLSIIKGE